MRAFFRWAAVVAAALALLSVLWIRLAPSDPEGWHVDPLAATVQPDGNAWTVVPSGGAASDVVTPVFAVPAEELARALDRVALAEPRTERIAGRPEDLWTTYLQRSRTMRFPDYISVRAVPLADGRSTLAVFSRSRFGYSDLGVNRARVERWLATLADELE